MHIPLALTAILLICCQRLANTFKQEISTTINRQFDLVLQRIFDELLLKSIKKPKREMSNVKTFPYNHKRALALQQVRSCNTYKEKSKK